MKQRAVVYGIHDSAVEIMNGSSIHFPFLRALLALTATSIQMLSVMCKNLFLSIDQNTYIGFSIINCQVMCTATEYLSNSDAYRFRLRNVSNISSYFTWKKLSRHVCNVQASVQVLMFKY